MAKRLSKRSNFVTVASSCNLMLDVKGSAATTAGPFLFTSLYALRALEFCLLISRFYSAMLVLLRGKID